MQRSFITGSSIGIASLVSSWSRRLISPSKSPSPSLRLPSSSSSSSPTPRALSRSALSSGSASLGVLPSSRRSSLMLRLVLEALCCWRSSSAILRPHALWAGPRMRGFDMGVALIWAWLGKGVVKKKKRAADHVYPHAKKERAGADLVPL